MCVYMHSDSDAVIGLAAHQERLNLPAGRRYFHLGACRFGILGTHHEPGLKATRRGVCVCVWLAIQVEASHWYAALFPGALSSG